jgi:hypothetical protein
MIVRDLVKELMQVWADDEERCKRELKIRKILATQRYPDADDDELHKILRTGRYSDEDDDNPRD